MFRLERSFCAEAFGFGSGIWFCAQVSGHRLGWNFRFVLRRSVLCSGVQFCARASSPVPSDSSFSNFATNSDTILSRFHVLLTLPVGARSNQRNWHQKGAKIQNSRLKPSVARASCVFRGVESLCFAFGAHLWPQVPSDSSFSNFATNSDTISSRFHVFCALPVGAAVISEIGAKRRRKSKIRVENDTHVGFSAPSNCSLLVPISLITAAPTGSVQNT